MSERPKAVVAYCLCGRASVSHLSTTVITKFLCPACPKDPPPRSHLSLVEQP